ncbi:MAG: hypothetical protein KJ574_03540 [Nanoarchaeota archaeon]|nr:hypothetical protein [Nanoarchaeota archaeon]
MTAKGNPRPIGPLSEEQIFSLLAKLYRKTTEESPATIKQGTCIRPGTVIVTLQDEVFVYMGRSADAYQELIERVGEDTQPSSPARPYLQVVPNEPAEAPTSEDSAAGVEAIVDAPRERRDTPVYFGTPPGAMQIPASAYEATTDAVAEPTPSVDFSDFRITIPPPGPTDEPYDSSREEIMGDINDHNREIEMLLAMGRKEEVETRIREFYDAWNRLSREDIESGASRLILAHPKYTIIREGLVDAVLEYVSTLPSRPADRK